MNTAKQNGEKISDLEALSWLIEVGADECIGEEPTDWFAQSAQPAKITATAIPSTAPMPAPKKAAPTIARREAQPVSSSDNLVADARKLASECTSIDDLIAALERFEGCPLSRTASNLSFLDGNLQAHTLLIDESPGREEDLQGKPLVGRAGQLLDKMISHIGLSRENETPEKSVLVTNLVFWRPPGNRKPTESETLMCVPFINKLIEITKPKIIVSFGAMPTQRLTGQSLGINRLRGRWFDYPLKNENIPVLATLRPSHLMTNPVQKSLAWQDLISLKIKLAGNKDPN